MALLITYIAIALSVSFLCSILEASLLTLTPSTIQTGKSKGSRWAVVMERLKKDIDRPLAAILTLNTVAHTMGAAGAGAQYAQVYGYGSEALFAAALTVAVLVLTEIIPKTIGARYARGLAPMTAAVLPVLIVALAPLVWFSKQLTRLITFGKPPSAPRHREELLAVAHLGHESGELHSDEARYLRNMLQLHRVRVDSMMTPRPVIFSLPAAMPTAEFAEAVRNTPFTRIPVYERDSDDIGAFVIRGEVLLEAARSGSARDRPIGTFARPLPTVLESFPADALFRKMVTEHHHVMLVVDEYGTVVGLVTLEDVLETIFGFEILDESDEVPDLQEYARELWRARASRLGLSNE